MSEANPNDVRSVGVHKTDSPQPTCYVLRATQHLQVSKTQANGATLSHIQALSKTERVEEIARMLGGIQITETTRNHAKEMLGL